MKCFKCNTELDWVGEYREITIRTHDFKNLNIKPMTREWLCMDCEL